jgi:hypothetical protein
MDGPSISQLYVSSVIYINMQTPRSKLAKAFSFAPKASLTQPCHHLDCCCLGVRVMS